MKKRFLAVILCLATLLTIVPATNVVAVGTQTTEYADYGAAIGNTAAFNIARSINFLMYTDPSGFDYDADWDNDDNWVYFDESTGQYDFDANLLLVIKNYYYDEETTALWYQIGAAPGYVLPEKLVASPWVFQNFTEEYEYDDWQEYAPDALLIEQAQNVVFDANGNVVTSVEIGLYDSVELECRSTLIGEPSYQWQILVGDEWVDIEGEDTASIGVKFTMLASAMNADQQVKVRCVSQSGSRKVTGDPITFYVDTYFDYDSYVHPEKPEPETPQEKALRSGSSSEIAPQDEGECYITIQYLFEDGTQAANSYVAEVPVGVESVVSAVFPYVQGYLPYYEGVRQDELTITDVFAENEVYTVVYKPTEVTYTVDIYFQNVENDLYSFYDSRTYEGLTGTQVPLNTQADFEGMQELLHETPIIAADGSTRVEVYYDRIYYMTRVHLDGGFGVYSVYARYGANLQPHLSAPTRPGYSFVGWDEYTVDSDDDGVPDSGGNEIADTVYPTVPAKNLAYVALWQENPTAQVNIVFWGENPNDEEYSYLNTKTLHVKPGTQLTYALSGNYVCGLDTHAHGNGCTTVCGYEEHTHSDEAGCYENCTYNHTHGTGCYNVTYRNNNNNNRQVTLIEVTLSSTITTLETANAWDFNNVVRIGNRNSGYSYYMKLDGTWYQLTRNNGITISSDTIVNVSYTNSCQGSHIHNNGCLSCTIHTHVGTCYACVEHTHSQANCGYPTFDRYSANLWELVKSDTVTVERDGTTVLNVYFDRTEFTLTFRHNGNTVATIKDKWGASISDEFSKAPFNPTHNGYPWECTDDDKYAYALQTLDVMPQFDAEFTRNNHSTNTKKTIYYYIQKPGTTVNENTWPNNQNNFTLLKQVDTYFNYATYAEEYHEMVGYKRYNKTVAGFGSGTSDRKDFTNQRLDLYYMLETYKLEFYNGNDVYKTEYPTYLVPLSTYSADIPPLPEEYEVGSHEFDGWYLNPDCTGEEVDLSTATMTAGNLALYAKWVPNYHTVRVVLQKNEDGVYGPEDSVLTTESVEVRHGNIVFSDADVKVPPTPENGLYKFLGWFYMNNGVEMMWDFEDRPVVKDTVIYAKWSSEVMVPYTIYYKDTQGNEVAPPLISSSLAGYYLTVDAKVGNELYADYRNGYFPQTVSHSIPLNIENAETGVEYTFVYEQAATVQYTVYHGYKDENGDFVELSHDTKDTGLAIVTETYDKRYLSDGYVPDAYQKTLVLSANPDNNHIHFFYTKADNKGVWFVGHYVQNKDDPGQYDTHFTDGDVTELDVEIKAEWPVDLSTDGFEFAYAEIDNGKSKITVYSLAEAKGAVTKEGLAIRAYYNRIKYPYKVVYRNKDTGQDILEAKVFTGDEMEPYGKTVTVLEPPNIQGYEYASAGSCTIVKDDPGNITKNIIYVYYTEQTIRIDFKVVGPAGCGTVNPESLFVKYASDNTATAQAIPAEKYHFVGWYYDEACTNPIVTSDKLKPNGEMLILQKHDGWAPATYYAKFEPAVANLTIVRNNASDRSQVYVYEVQNNTTGEVLYVTVVGNGQVTIHGLPMGEYTVTQQNGWSWRYDDPAQSIVHQIVDGTIVVFNGSASNDQWLNGNSELVENKRG